MEEKISFIDLGTEFSDKFLKVLTMYDKQEIDSMQVLVKFTEMYTKILFKALGPTYDKKTVKAMMESCLRRHTWMKDGVTYVGNGTYTLAQAQKMLEADYKDYLYKDAA